MLPDRFFAGEIQINEGLIDHGYARRLRVVMGVEVAPGEQRNLHGLEKVLAHVLDVGDVSVPALRVC